MANGCLKELRKCIRRSLAVAIKHDNLKTTTMDIHWAEGDSCNLHSFYECKRDAAESRLLYSFHTDKLAIALYV